jgi:AcrR family transcriptional regulator
MSRVKKPAAKRAYSSPARAEQARQTRVRIVEAAGALFESNGYGLTTIKQIADAAGVAVDTVYATYGTKAKVLTALVDSRLAPAGESNVMDRPEAIAIADVKDQREQVRLFAKDFAAVVTRVAPFYEILRTASAVEPDMTATLAEMDGYRFQNLRRALGWISANGPLRMDLDRATEFVWAIANPDVARMLRTGRGYNEADFAAFLDDVIARLLLPDHVTPPTRRRRASGRVRGG